MFFKNRKKQSKLLECEVENVLKPFFQEKIMELMNLIQIRLNALEADVEGIKLKFKKKIPINKEDSEKDEKSKNIYSDVLLPE